MFKLIGNRGKSNNDDLFNTCSSLLKSKNILYTDLHLKSLLTEHIYYPSLLAIHDALLQYGVTSLAVTRGEYSYHDFELPFICAIQKDEWLNSAITIVTKVTDEQIQYLDPIKNKPTFVTIEKFLLMDTGSLMLVDTTNGVNEKNLRRNINSQLRKTVLASVPLALVILILISCSIYIVNHFTPNQGWMALVYLFTAFTGVMISLVLISHEVDRDNKFLKKVCGNVTKKVNCRAVLSSAQSSGLGVSWSIWGGAYFGTLFLIQSLFVNNVSFLKVTATLSVMVVPFVLYSIFVQWQIIRQWCFLCLGIQALLIINAYIAIFAFTKSDGRFQHVAFQLQPFVTTLLIGASLSIMILTLIPILKVARDGKLLERKLRILKSDMNVFSYYLKKGDSFIASPFNMGFTFGNTSAPNEIVEVCNPNCQYCAMMNTKLKVLLSENTNVRVRILFKVSDVKGALDRIIVCHFLKIHKKYGSDVLQSALDYWYSNSTNNVVSFVNRFEIDNDHNDYEEQIDNMNDWTNSMRISVTPTLFFNGYKVPLLFDIDDIIEILKFPK